jgi:hypothetical protein
MDAFVAIHGSPARRLIAPRDRHCAGMTMARLEAAAAMAWALPIAVL